MDLSTLNPIELIDQFKVKARNWWATYQRFQSQASLYQSSPLASQYNALMKNGVEVRAAIESATKKIDSVNALYQSAINATSAGIEKVAGWLGLGGLGVLPAVAIPVAVGITIIAGWKAIDAWEANARQLEALYGAQSTRAQLASSLAEKGYSPAQIQQAMKAAEGSPPPSERGVIDQAAGLVKWGAIAFAVIYFGPKLYKMFVEKRA